MNAYEPDGEGTARPLCALPISAVFCSRSRPARARRITGGKTEYRRDEKSAESGQRACGPSGETATGGADGW